MKPFTEIDALNTFREYNDISEVYITPTGRLNIITKLGKQFIKIVDRDKGKTIKYSRDQFICSECGGRKKYIDKSLSYEGYGIETNCQNCKDENGISTGLALPDR